MDGPVLTIETNVVEKEAYTRLYDATCQIIYERLSRHCGPLAKNALIIQHDANRSTKSSNVFTKDGADIIRSMEFDDPLSTHVKNQIYYVGSRIDSIAHDGTTTSMMLFSDMIRTIPKVLRDNYTSLQINSIMDRVCDYLTDVLKQRTITIKRLIEDFDITEREARRFIAYNQAMVSSKGDRTIADAIVEVIDNLPVELYGQFTLSQNRLETDKRITVKYDDYDFTIVATTEPNNLNYNLNTEYFTECCDVLIAENELIYGVPEFDAVLGYISSLIDGTVVLDKDLIIITKSHISQLADPIATYNKSHKKKVIVFAIATGATYIGRDMTLAAILACAGRYPMIDCLDQYGNIQVTDSIIQNVKIHLKDKYVYVSNLYKRDGEIYHPFFKNKESFPPYTKMIADIKEFLDADNKGHSKAETPQRQQQISDFTNIYRRMICQVVCRIEISGTTHDSLADHGVVVDAHGAVLSSLEKGFVLDGFWALFDSCLKDNVPYSIQDGGCGVDQTLAVISSMILKMLSIIHNVNENDILLKNTKFHNDNLEDFTIGIDEPQDVDSLSMFNSPPISDVYEPCHPWYTFVTAPHLQEGRIIKRMSDGTLTTKHTEYALLQPIAGYTELIKRIRELVPKFANTVCSITPGTFN